MDLPGDNITSKKFETFATVDGLTEHKPILTVLYKICLWKRLLTVHKSSPLKVLTFKDGLCIFASKSPNCRDGFSLLSLIGNFNNGFLLTID